MGLINSISCRIWDGVFDSMRATILTCGSALEKGEIDTDNNARLERLGKEAYDHAIFYNIHCKG